MKNNILPNFLIVGTMKSGTSTLADYLARSADIHIPNREVHYFNKDANYSKGSSWYSRQLTHGLSANDHNENLLFGEKTPTYSYQPNCAERIKETVPNVKLIWIFRDPVRRAFSNYLHARKQGLEPLSFRQSVEREKERVERNIFYGYIERSKYVIQVERFLRLFPISGMHFLLFEDLVNSPHDELDKISEFLGVSKFGELPTVHSNETTMPISPMSIYLAQKIGGHGSFFHKATRKINLKLAEVLPKRSPLIPSDIANDLSRVFAPYNKRLEELTGLELSTWRTHDS
jgi:hypothetical protein